jgi:hypothetical protein
VVEITAIRIHTPLSSLGKTKNKENINLFFARNRTGSTLSNHTPRQEVSRRVPYWFVSKFRYRAFLR